MEQLAAAWTELTQFQQEQQHWLEEGQRQQEERRQHDEDQRRQQYEAYQEQVRIMHEQQVEQMGVMREVLKIHVDWNTTTLENVTVTRKKLPEKVEWNSRAELAFQRLKDMLISAPLMKNPDFNRTFILQTDAANKKVTEELSSNAYCGKKRGPYKKYTPQEKATIVNYAVQHGTSAALRNWDTQRSMCRPEMDYREWLEKSNH